MQCSNAHWSMSMISYWLKAELTPSHFISYFAHVVYIPHSVFMFIFPFCFFCLLPLRFWVSLLICLYKYILIFYFHVFTSAQIIFLSLYTPPHTHTPVCEFQWNLHLEDITPVLFCVKYSQNLGFTWCYCNYVKNSRYCLATR